MEQLSVGPPYLTIRTYFLFILRVKNKLKWLITPNPKHSKIRLNFILFSSFKNHSVESPLQHYFIFMFDRLSWVSSNCSKVHSNYFHNNSVLNILVTVTVSTCEYIAKDDEWMVSAFYLSYHWQQRNCHSFKRQKSRPHYWDSN